MAIEPIELLSFQELYDKAKAELQARTPDITDFSEGSIADAIIGVSATLAEELQTLLVDRFNNTFTELAEGEKLDTLLVDHFGDSFARPQATKAQGTVTFSRPTATAGAVSIPLGTVVSTPTDSLGVAQKFVTTEAVSLTASGPGSLTVDADVEAQIAGKDGNVADATVNIIDTSLTDSSIVVTNADAFAGGTDEATDAEYRVFAKNKIESIRGGTTAAIEATALTVPGVVNAVVVEIQQTVIEWDDALDVPIGDAFFIPRAKLYIADENGAAPTTLIEDVREAIFPVRACGVEIDIIGASALSLQWNISLVFNPLGPNYATLSIDPGSIKKTAQDYINDLAIGADFIRADGELAIMAVWGPSGSNDLVSVSTNIPVGDVDAGTVDKFVAQLTDITVT